MKIRIYKTILIICTLYMLVHVLRILVLKRKKTNPPNKRPIGHIAYLSIGFQQYTSMR